MGKVNAASRALFKLLLETLRADIPGNLKVRNSLDKSRVAKFDPKVGSRRTTKIKNRVVLIIILVVLILLPYYMYVVLVPILLFLLVRER